MFSRRKINSVASADLFVPIHHLTNYNFFFFFLLKNIKNSFSTFLNFKICTRKLDTITLLQKNKLKFEINLGRDIKSLAISYLFFFLIFCLENGKTLEWILELEISRENWQRETFFFVFFLIFTRFWFRWPPARVIKPIRIVLPFRKLHKLFYRKINEGLP